MKRYEIDPKQFTQGQWEELFYCSQLAPSSYEFYRNAKPFKRGKKQIELAILCCRGKALDITDGSMGSEAFEGEDEQWVSDLEGAASVLEGIIGVVRVSRKARVERLRDLLTSDIYTDAPEYASRVQEVHELLDVLR